MASLQEQFQKEGYIVVKGLLDPEQDIQPLEEAYIEVLNALTRLYLIESNAEALARYDDISLPERFAMLLGASRGTALHHLDPVLNIFAKTFRWRKDLPNARIPEMFDLMSHSKVLDVLEQLIGPEIAASPIYHVNFKLSLDHLKLADQVAESIGADLSEESFYTFQVGKTGWHMDAISGLPDSHESQIVNTWIPISHASEENGCLLVIPGSHKDGVKYRPYPEDLDERSISLPVEPGDVVFLDNKVMHGSTQNTSKDDYRWAYNFRYLPIGQPSGRPFLPGFVARSRSAPETELHNAHLWSTMWVRSLDYLTEKGAPTSYENVSKMGVKEAAEITQHWRDLAPDTDGWLRLGKD
jgi:phytanoyl-CoA hydroxylase